MHLSAGARASYLSPKFVTSSMHKLVFILAVAAIVLSATSSFSQSRKGVSSGGKTKANQRAPRPSPTATPIADDENDTGEEITVDTRIVTIPVRVIDRKNRFVAGLQKQDFQVFENGAPQEVAHFTNESQPFTVALVLDMSYSTVFKIAEIQSAAISFIDQLRPDDRVMVISFDEEVQMLCEATNDRQRIYRAIKSTRISTGTSLYDAVDLTMNDRLRKIEGRKAIVLFTDGVDTTSNTSHDLENLSDAMEIDALIYPIRYDTFADVQAMKDRHVATLPGQRPTTTPPTIPTSGGVPFPPPGPAIGTPGGRGTSREEYEAAERYLDQLAVRTGGTVYLASGFGNLNFAFSKIAGELREFYSLGYYPPETAMPGQTRRLKVKVARENVAVRARDSYVVNMQKPARK
ncbi:MAG: VWA domain-containing protein [Pyrinomonadaceae bacterium]